MSAMTDYLEGQLIAHIFRTASFTKPSALRVRLFTAAPGESGGGTEVTGGSYAAVNNNPADANWAAPAGGNGQTSNVGGLTFPAPTANWGTITHVVIDDGNDSNRLFYGALTQSKTVNNGDPAPSFPASSLVVTLA